MKKIQFKIIFSITAVFFLGGYALLSWPVSFERTDLKTHDSDAEICKNSTLLKPKDEVACCTEELGTFRGKDGTFVINSQEEYDEIKQRVEKKGCKWKEGPKKIDFSEKTLLGQYLEAPVCTSNPDIEVYKDFINKRIDYTLETPYCSSSAVSINTYWVLVPKVPSEHTVNFHTSTDLLSVVWQIPKGALSFFMGRLE
ncbi:MAG: hypothetical protein ABEJ02_04450 [Candidatus Paceibacteria bacterium]